LGIKEKGEQVAPPQKTEIDTKNRKNS